MTSSSSNRLTRLSGFDPVLTHKSKSRHRPVRFHKFLATKFRRSECTRKIVQTSNFQKRLTFVQILTRKSKISKQTCPTQFFEYIPILGPVSSFEAQKLCKRPISKKVNFCADIDQMSKFLRWTYLAQFFEYIPILRPISSFEARKLCKRPISKKVDFCANVDQMSKFLGWTYFA